VAFVEGVTAAAVGAIAGAVIVLGRRTIFGDGYTPDILKVFLLAATIGLLWKFKKLPEPVIVLGAALIGVVVYPLVAR
jgi:chromate transporter